ncbi:expressed unknown protein [Seminavis robusta]|uniref:Succinate dehydrogenase [ubiquinone] cytochrome b small subunit n=1 Tax=Seminavis robusta TaxID=568900 RepID=A0A9N8HJH9_9STRA|nr:expressed unknown protein [Seminavis robusta]|eukprot:Sro767_g199530.1 n/a (144) ;mRNA; f:40678-41225
MFRYTGTTRSVVKRAVRKFSGSPLEADSGGLATRGHHAMILALTVATPVYLVLPEESSVSRGLGVLLTGNIAAHSWIGMNYVCTDYVPKVSKALLGPSRYFNAGLAIITFVGLTKMSLSSPGGIKGAVRGLWNPPAAAPAEKK